MFWNQFLWLSKFIWKWPTTCKRPTTIIIIIISAYLMLRQKENWYLWWIIREAACYQILWAAKKWRMKRKMFLQHAIRAANETDPTSTQPKLSSVYFHSAHSARGYILQPQPALITWTALCLKKLPLLHLRSGRVRNVVDLFSWWTVYLYVFCF